MKRFNSIVNLKCVLFFSLLLNQVFGQNDSPPKVEKPNVIIINADDIGFGDIGIYGATHVRTPAIDQLAKDGRIFIDAHSASAVCSPSRYALITGVYPSRIDFWSPLFVKAPLVVDTAQITIADVMKSAGYKTAVIGKWHLGFTNENPVNWNKKLKPGPLELGFDYYFGVPVLNSHPPFLYVENHRVVGWDENDPLVYDKPAETRWFQEKFGLDAIGGGSRAHFLYDDRMIGTTLTEKAVDWIKSNKKKPFFLYLATTNIHHPFTPAPRFIGSSDAGRYGDSIHELDWIVSEIVNALDEEGLTENTLVIFTSDNGPMLNQGGQDARKKGHIANGELLGFKFDAWEGGHRIPFIAKWPGKIPSGSKSSELISNVDLLATMASLVGYELQDDQAIDSYDILPAIVGNARKPIRDHLVISPSRKNNIAIRKGKWMYISDQGGGGFSKTELGEHGFGGPAAFPFTGQVNSDIENGKIRVNAPPAQLYDLDNDLRETTNVYNENPKIVEELRAYLKMVLSSNKTIANREIR